MRLPSLFATLASSAIALAVASGHLAAQSVGSDLRTLTTANAQGYVEPLTRGGAFAMGGGAFDGASVLDALGFNVGVRVSGALPPTTSEEFAPTVPDQVTWEETTYQDPYRTEGETGLSPTIAGTGPGAIVEPSGDFRSALMAAGQEPSDYAVILPAGRDTPVIPYPAFHASLGIGIGTELTLRYVPDIEADEEIGDLHGFGFGARHELTRWLRSPIDVSILALRQELEVGGYADARSTQLGVVAGRTMGPLSLFATGVLREARVEIRYRSDNPGNRNPTLPPDGETIAFSEEVEPRTVFGVGAKIQLLILDVAGQYTFDKYSVVTLKIGLGAG